MLQKIDFGNVTVTQLLVNALTAPRVDLNSTVVDLLEHDGCLFVVNMGDSGDTLSGSVYAEFEIEHSIDNSTWTDVADADLSSSVTGTNTGTFAKVDAPGGDSIVFTVAYLGRNRYARFVLNVTGTHTNGFELSVNVILTRDKYS